MLMEATGIEYPIFILDGTSSDFCDLLVSTVNFVRRLPT